VSKREPELNVNFSLIENSSPLKNTQQKAIYNKTQLTAPVLTQKHK
jgi:hypothetical protein